MPEQDFASLYSPGGGGRLRNRLSRMKSRTQTNRKTRRKRESKTEKRGREECERPGGGDMTKNFMNPTLKTANSASEVLGS